MQTSTSCGCLTCDGPLRCIFDFGLQPLANQMQDAQGVAAPAFPRKLAQCPSCGLIQFMSHIPPRVLRPAQALRFNEPEDHLDDLADRLLSLSGPSSTGLVLGASYKDASLLDRISKRTGVRTRVIDPATDLDCSWESAGLESFQELFDEIAADRISSKHGRATILVVRHFLEHAQDFSRFFRAAARLLQPGGILVLEEPDCARALEANDCSTIWEERSAFFTKATLTSTLSRFGWEVRLSKSYPYPLEDALVVACEWKGFESYRADGTAAELARAATYAEQFPRVRAQLQERLKTLAADGREIAIFGAGHMAVNFVNLNGLGDVVTFAVDDNPKKLGKFLPGSGRPVLPSSALEERPVSLCLLTVRPEIEEVIMRKFPAFLSGGGRFASILPNRPTSIFSELPP